MTLFPWILPSVLGELQHASCLCACAVEGAPPEGKLVISVLTKPEEGGLE